MKNKGYVAITMALTGALCVGSLAGCGKKEEITVDANETVATINGEEIPVGIVAFTTRYQQMYTEMLYQSYMGSSASAMWDQVLDEEAGTTYGEDAVTEALDQVELMYLLKEHAEEYSVALTDQDMENIKAAAQSFQEENGEEVLAEIPTNQECMQEYLELLTYQQKMRAPIVAGVDKEVSEDESQQATISYVVYTKSAEETAEETTEEATEPTEGNEELKAKAQEILDAMLKDETQDFNEVATSIDENAVVSSNSYTIKDEEDTTVPQEVKDAVASLQDGQMAPELVETESGIYVVRLDAALDADATESKVESIIAEREDNLYTEVTDGWKNEASIEVKDDVKKGIKVNGKHIYTFKIEEVADDELDQAEVIEDEAELPDDNTESLEDTAVTETEENLDSMENAETLEEAPEETPEETAEETGE